MVSSSFEGSVIKKSEESLIQSSLVQLIFASLFTFTPLQSSSIFTYPSHIFIHTYIHPYIHPSIHPYIHPTHTMASPHSPSKAESLALHFLEHRPSPLESSPSLVAQMQHRLALVAFWAIQPGSRVLEIGCGQGDCTIVLADAVGEEGHVDAVDPGLPDYGELGRYFLGSLLYGILVPPGVGTFRFFSSPSHPAG